MHISITPEHRPGFLAASRACAVDSLAAFATAGDEPDWRQPLRPQYRGGRIIASYARTWSSLCAVVVDVRADGPIQVPLEAGFARVCMPIEEVGGVLQVSGTSEATRWQPPLRSAISVIPPGMSAVGQAKTMHFMRHLLLQLDGPTLAAWLEERVDIEATLKPRLMASDPQLLQLGHLIAKECMAGRMGDRLYCDGLVVAVLGALANLPGGSGDRCATRGGLAPWQLRRITDYLNEHLADAVDMAALAGIAGLSKSHFSRAFKTSTGLPPHRWLLNARIARARELLIDSDLPLAEISLAVGFADQAHFTRTFGGIVGSSPRVWQRARRP